MLAHTRAVVSDDFLSLVEFEAALLDQVAHHLDLLNVVGSIESRALVVAPGLDDGELLLPKTQRGL